jgi:ATP synthase protein I
MAEDSKTPGSSLKDLSELGVIGLTLVIATVMGYYIGHWVETRWPQIQPWGVLTGIILGIIAGFLEMFRTIRRIERRMSEPGEGSIKSDDT